MAELNFNAAQVEPDAGQLGPIPKDWYNAAMTASEMKPTKDGTGALLECIFSVLDGQYVGRKVYSRLNLRNNNSVAQEIGYRQLSAIAHAVNVIQVQDSAQLHNIPLKIRVKVTTATVDYDSQNEITAYKNINENVGGTAQPAPAPIAAPAAPAPIAPPPAPQYAPAPAQPVVPQAGAAAPQWQQPAPQQAPLNANPVPAPAPAPAAQWQQPAAPQPWQDPNAQPAAPAHVVTAAGPVTSTPNPNLAPAPVAAPVQAQPVAQPVAAPVQQAPAVAPQNAAPPWNQAPAQ